MEINNEENGDIIDKSMTHLHFWTKNKEKDLFVHVLNDKGLKWEKIKDKGPKYYK